MERKVKPKDNPFEYKKRLTLDQEKSKMSLGEIYEQEYLKQQKVTHCRQGKNCDNFLTSAQNIGCGYLLGISNKYPQPMF